MAEYYGAGKALRFILDTYKRNDRITLHCDSQLVLNQVWGEWACNKDDLRALRDRCRELIRTIEAKGIILSQQWIKSADNLADQFTRQAYEQHTGKAYMPFRKAA